MKKLILTCTILVIFVGKGVAQYAATPSKAELTYKMSVNSPYHYHKYKSGSTLASFGAGLTIGGVAAAIIGVAVADKETIKDGTSTTINLSGPGAGVFVVGMVSALAGTPLWIIGGTKKRNAMNSYLREFGYSYQAPVQPSPYLQLNSTSNGLGLAFVF